jgi:hypothetical protein
MKKYYSERNGLIKNSLSLSLDELKNYFKKSNNIDQLTLDN